MKFAYAVANVLSNFAEFRGRASLAEFWWWALFCLIVMSVLTLADGAISAPAMGFEMFSLQAGRPLSLVGALLLSVPTLAVSCRRLHDAGRAGFWALAGFVPVAGWALMLWFLTRPTSRRANRYGSSVAGLQRT